jgi:hypothetical protein
MIKKLTLMVVLVLTAFFTSGQVKIGDNPTTLSSSSILELESTSKGFVPTRLDANQISNLADPATGMMVYNTNLSCIQVNLGTPAIPAWECLATSGSSMVDPVSKYRNWTFGNTQGGGSGNVGLEISLPRIGSNGIISHVLVTKFLTVPGESISKVQLVMYSNAAFNLGLTIDEGTLDPSNVNAPGTRLYPRPGDGDIVVNGNPVLVGQSVPIIELGPNAYDKIPQVVEFNFNPALTPTESAMTLYSKNLSISGTTPTIGIFQVVID